MTIDHLPRQARDKHDKRLRFRQHVFSFLLLAGGGARSRRKSCWSKRILPLASRRSTSWAQSTRGKKTALFLIHFLYMIMTILPRQARDRHQENFVCPEPVLVKWSVYSGQTLYIREFILLKPPCTQAEAPSWAAARSVRSQYDPEVPRDGVETDGGREQRGRDDCEPGTDSVRLHDCVED
jgi:hypothetical protein